MSIEEDPWIPQRWKSHGGNDGWIFIDGYHAGVNLCWQDGFHCDQSACAEHDNKDCFEKFHCSFTFVGIFGLME